MPRLGHHPLPKQVLQQVARLLQIHFQTHPKRIARRLGLTDRYVRQVWHEIEVHEMASLSDALELLRNAHGETDVQRAKEPAEV